MENSNSLLTAGVLSFQCPAGSGALARKKLWHLVKCVWCECVCNPLRQHPLGAAKGTSNRLTFLTASDRAQSAELFIQVLWGKVAIFTEETNPRVNCGCLSLQANTVVMIWVCDGFLAKWQPFSVSSNVESCFTGQSKPLQLNHPNIVFLFVFHLTCRGQFSAIPYVMRKILIKGNHLITFICSHNITANSKVNLPKSQKEKYVLSLTFNVIKLY